MLPNSWRSKLQQLLNPPHKPAAPRLALVGIGNELNADDSAGVLVIRQLGEHLPPHPGRLLVDAGLAPESYAGPLRRFGPELVILIDAAEMQSLPGTIELLDWQESDGLSATTHTLPPSVLAEYLIAELNCRVALLCIQPLRLDFDQPPSAAVLQAVDQVVAALREALHPAD